MAKSFKELGRKAEELLEEGREADSRVRSVQAGVAAASRQVAAARIQMENASETDENGNPRGDVQTARAQLNVAQQQLAASQRALAAAQQNAARVRQEKNAHVREIASHNQIERQNLEKLRALAAGPFSENAAALTRGIAERFNEAERTRVALLKSMGIEAVAETVPVDFLSSSALGWQVGGFAALDLSGTPTSYRGGAGAASSGGGGSDAAAPTDRAALSVPAGEPSGDAGGASSAGLRKFHDLRQPGTPTVDAEAFRNGYTAGGSRVSERLAELRNLRAQLLSAIAAQYAQAEAEGIAEAVKVLKLSDRQYYDMGMRYIDNIMEVYRDNLRDRGVSDGQAMEAALAPIRAELLQRLNRDLAEGTYEFDKLPDPDFETLETRARSLYEKYPPKYKFSDIDRRKLREGIRSGTVTEKEIRNIGRDLREHHEALITKRNAEYDRIRREQDALMLQARQARTSEEKERIELQRKLLQEQENSYNRSYNSTAMMKAVLEPYRPLGPGEKTPPQNYESEGSSGAGKVIRAINNVREAIPTDWVKTGNSRPIAVRHVERGFFRADTDKDVIALSGDGRHLESVAFHEMGHRFEHLYPEILALEKQFYERRTRGEALTHLGPGYGAREYSRFDHFIDPYMGKDYGGSGYELLSMGMEAAFCGTYNLARDTDFQDFIFGILATV